MKRDREVHFSPEEERALNELKAEYRKLLLEKENRGSRPSVRIRPPKALSGNAGRMLTAGLLAVSVICLLAAAAMLFRTFLPLPAPAAYSAAHAALSERLAPPPPEDFPDAGVMINTAGPDQLILLPGVGPVLAERIIEEREKNGYFRLPEDLLAVRGIGTAALKKLRPLISFAVPEESACPDLPDGAEETAE